MMMVVRSLRWTLDYTIPTQKRGDWRKQKWSRLRWAWEGWYGEQVTIIHKTGNTKAVADMKMQGNIIEETQVEMEQHSPQELERLEDESGIDYRHVEMN